MTTYSGKLVLILGSSGSGKGTLERELKARHPEYLLPPSLTSRPKRPDEEEGDIYNFVSVQEFKEAIEKGMLLEWALSHGKDYYGIPKKPIIDALLAGKVIIREVNIDGLHTIKKALPRDSFVSIFITVPSWEELKQRIIERGSMSDEEIDRRAKSFKREQSLSLQTDYVIENRSGEQEKFFTDAEAIIERELAS